MSKLHDYLQMPISRVDGPSEITLDQLPEAGYQLLLPFEKPIQFDLELLPRKSEVVSVRFRLKQAN